MIPKLPNSFLEGDLFQLAKRLGLQKQSSLTFLRLALENTVLFDKKEQDYGPNNIAAFRDFGCVIRMTDKVNRLATLYNNRRRPRNEAINDTYRDISNYALIALMCRRNEWPIVDGDLTSVIQEINKPNDLGIIPDTEPYKGGV